jgi:phospholipid transport system substrate-binding protein
MHLKKGRWLVYDIIIEGVSLVTNYRSSFNGQIKKIGSLQKMIDKLHDNNVAALAP